MNAQILAHTLPAAVMAAGNVPIKFARTIPLPDVHGHFDDFAVDVAGRCLFLGVEGAHAVEVVDLTTGARLGQIQDEKEPHTIFFMPHCNLPSVKDGVEGTCDVFDGTHAKAGAPARILAYRLM